MVNTLEFDKEYQSPEFYMAVLDKMDPSLRIRFLDMASDLTLAIKRKAQQNALPGEQPKEVSFGQTSVLELLFKISELAVLTDANIGNYEMSLIERVEVWLMLISESKPTVLMV